MSFSSCYIASHGTWDKTRGDLDPFFSWRIKVNGLTKRIFTPMFHCRVLLIYSFIYRRKRIYSCRLYKTHKCSTREPFLPRSHGASGCRLPRVIQDEGASSAIHIWNNLCLCLNISIMLEQDQFLNLMIL